MICAKLRFPTEKANDGEEKPVLEKKTRVTFHALDDIMVYQVTFFGIFFYQRVRIKSTTPSYPFINIVFRLLAT